jgi:hypothetical protein
MVLATSNRVKNLLQVSYIGHVRVADFVPNHDELKGLLAGLEDGFRLLADFSALEAMDMDCATEVGQFMELMDQAGVGLIVRVIPDPKKDIGMNILTLFHYRNRPRTVTCPTIIEAIRALSL